MMLKSLLALTLSLATGLLHAGSASPLFDGAAHKGFKARNAQAHNHAAAPAVGEETEIDPRFWVTIHAEDRDTRTRAANAGLAIESVRDKDIAGIAGPGTLRRLKAAGLRVLEAIPLDEFASQIFPPGDQLYHDYEEARSLMKEIASTNPKITSLFSIGTSIQGREILALRFHQDESNPSENARPKPGVAFLGTHHAREHLSTEVPLRVAKWIADNKSQPRVAKLLRSRDIYFIPMVNPDGVEYDIATGRYRWQRKNMRNNGNGSWGVDLNRNYSYKWGQNGASPNPDSDLYRGPRPFSEPESAAVRDFLASRSGVNIVLTYHSYSELILYPWGYTEERISDPLALLAYERMAQRMASMTGYRPMQASGLYIVSGETCDWAWGTLKKFCFTFELTPRSMAAGGFYPGSRAIESTVEKNIAPALYLIEIADNPKRP